MNLLYIMNVENYIPALLGGGSLGTSQGYQGQGLCPTLFTPATMHNTDNMGTLASLQSGIFAVQSQKFNKFIFIYISEEENVYETYNFSVLSTYSGLVNRDAVRALVGMQ